MDRNCKGIIKELEIIPKICRFEVGPIGAVRTKNTLTPGTITITGRSPRESTNELVVKKHNAQINDFLKTVSRINKHCLVTINNEASESSTESDIPSGYYNYVSIKVFPKRVPKRKLGDI